MPQKDSPACSPAVGRWVVSFVACAVRRKGGTNELYGKQEANSRKDITYNGAGQKS